MPAPMGPPDLTTCPFCGNLARVVRDAVTHHACGLCRAPRIPGTELTPRDCQELADARRDLMKARVEQVASVFLVGLGATSGLVGVMTVVGAHIFGAVLLALCTLFIAGALRLRALARRAGTSGQQALDATWARAVLGELAASDALSCEQLAARFDVPLRAAEHWLGLAAATQAITLHASPADERAYYSHAETLEDAGHGTSLSGHATALRDFDARLRVAVTSSDPQATAEPPPAPAGFALTTTANAEPASKEKAS